MDDLTDDDSTLAARLYEAAEARSYTQARLGELHRGGPYAAMRGALTAEAADLNAAARAVEQRDTLASTLEAITEVGDRVTVRLAGQIEVGDTFYASYLVAGCSIGTELPDMRCGWLTVGEVKRRATGSVTFVCQVAADPSQTRLAEYPEDAPVVTAVPNTD